MNGSHPPSMTSSRWGLQTKRIATIGALLFLGFALWNLRQVILILVVASLLAYLLHPLAYFFERRVLGLMPFPTRSLSVILAFMTVIAFFVLFLILIVPVLINQVSTAGQNLPELLQSIEIRVEDFLSTPIKINGRPVLFNGEPIILLDRLAEITGSSSTGMAQTAEDVDIMQISGSLLGSIDNLTGPAFSIVGGAFDAIINLMFVIAIIFFLTRDGDQLTHHLIYSLPESYRGDARRLLYELGRIWNAYLRGQLVLNVSVGIAVYLSALVLGLPNAAILGMLAALLEFIPTLGPFFALIPAAITALLSQSSTLPFLSGIPFALVVIAVWTLIQNLEAIFLVPRVMGRRLNLHPALVIVAILTGASIAGFVGIILAAPITATVRLLIRYFYGKLLNTNPFPPPEPQSESPSLKLWVRFYQVILRHTGHFATDAETYTGIAPEQPSIVATQPKPKEEIRP